MYEGGDGQNHETFPYIPDEPSKPQSFFTLEIFVIYGSNTVLYDRNREVLRFLAQKPHPKTSQLFILWQQGSIRKAYMYPSPKMSSDQF